MHIYVQVVDCEQQLITCKCGDASYNICSRERVTIVQTNKNVILYRERIKYKEKLFYRHPVENCKKQQRSTNQISLRSLTEIFVNNI